jgi:tetratricopeptide (TPR) repeat protein
MIYTKSKEYVIANGYLEKLHEYWKKDIKLITIIGENYSFLNAYDKAIEYFLKARNIADDIGVKFDSCYSLSYCYFEQNKIDLAYITALEGVIRDPQDIEVRAILAKILVELKDFHQAKGQFEQIFSLYDNSLFNDKLCKNTIANQIAFNNKSFYLKIYSKKIPKYSHTPPVLIKDSKFEEGEIFVDNISQGIEIITSNLDECPSLIGESFKID